MDVGLSSCPDGKAEILFTRSGQDVSSLLVKFFELPTESDLEQFKKLGAVSVEPVFTSCPGKEALEHKFGLDLWYEVQTDGSISDDFAEIVSTLAQVSKLEYNIRLSQASDRKFYSAGNDFETRAADNVPFNDPMLSKQWNYRNSGNASIAKTAYKGGDVNIYDVWNNITAGDPSIIVAVVDEGVKYSHPDLVSNMWTNIAELNGRPGVDDDGNGYIDDIYGYNFVDNGDITWDKTYDSGHGTHCAGIIAATNNNGRGISGTAGGTGKNDGVRIMSCQIFSGNNGGTLKVTSRAIKYAADMGASIISCSFGYKGGSFLSDKAYSNFGGMEKDAIDYFEASRNNDVLDGNIAIFASGNDGDPYATYPGALADIISVSAFGPDYLPAYYTNYGPGCNIVAPGGEACLPPFTSYAALILSTLPSELNDGDDYGYMQGTSMACPHVSGIAALGISRLIQLGKTMTVRQFKEYLVTSANDFDSRIKGTKTYAKNTRPDLELYPYLHQMGTGSVDAWLFMMKLEGIPSLLAKEGENQWLDLSKHFGTSSPNLTYIGVEVSDEARQSLGLVEDPYIKYGRLYIHPTRCGSAKITIKAIGGGTALGGDEQIGGMEISQEVSVVVRSFKSSNGGWL